MEYIGISIIVILLLTNFFTVKKYKAIKKEKGICVDKLIEASKSYDDAVRTIVEGKKAYSILSDNNVSLKVKLSEMIEMIDMSNATISTLEKSCTVLMNEANSFIDYSQSVKVKVNEMTRVDDLIVETRQELMQRLLLDIAMRTYIGYIQEKDGLYLKLTGIATVKEYPKKLKKWQYKCGNCQTVKIFTGIPVKDCKCGVMHWKLLKLQKKHKLIDNSAFAHPEGVIWSEETDKIFIVKPKK